MGSENVYFVQNHIFEVPLRAGRLAIPGLNIITMEVVEVTSTLISTLKTLHVKKSDFNSQQCENPTIVIVPIFNKSSHWTRELTLAFLNFSHTTSYAEKVIFSS